MSSAATPTIAECMRRATSLAAISESARLDVEVLLCHLLGRDRSYLYTWPERNLTPEQASEFERLLAQRERGIPVAHLTGYREFWSLELKVNASTLIPRPETELLVELALALLPADPRRVVDLGTGTGAIALALASERPRWELVALDKSPAAVALAEDNRRHLGFNHVRVLQSDWFAAIPGQQFDLVVSNPPYIDPADPHLRQGDVRFEPLTALVADDAGYADLRRIATDAQSHLTPGGYVLMEHGCDQGAGVRQLLDAAGYVQVKTHTDLAGLERVTQGCLGLQKTGRSD